jgi:hypothetical protein
LVAKITLRRGLHHVHRQPMLQKPSRQIHEYALDAAMNEAGME